MKIIAFMNAYSQGKSGGDVFFIEVAKRLQYYDKVVVTSLLGKELCRTSGLEGNFLITSRERVFRNIILTYLQRTLVALFLKLKPEEGDILLGTSDFLPDVLPIFWLKARNKKVKWVQHIFHLIPPTRKIPFWAQRMSLVLIRQMADTVIVDNNLLKSDLANAGFDPQKIFVNYPGIDLAYLRSVAVGNRRGYDGIFMARFHPSKGILDLVRIWKAVCERRPNARLGVIGAGSEALVEEFKSLVKTDGLEKNIKLLGYLEDDLAFAAVKASRIFIFPSHEEGFGIAALEAMACGLPVVAWDLPVYREVFKKGMVRVSLGEHQQFADAVIELLGDEERCAKMGQEAKFFVRGYGWEKVAEKEWKIIGVKVSNSK